MTLYSRRSEVSHARRLRACVQRDGAAGAGTVGSAWRVSLCAACGRWATHGPSHTWRTSLAPPAFTMSRKHCGGLNLEPPSPLARYAPLGISAKFPEPLGAPPVGILPADIRPMTLPHWNRPCWHQHAPAAAPPASIPPLMHASRGWVPQRPACRLRNHGCTRRTRHIPLPAAVRGRGGRPPIRRDAACATVARPASCAIHASRGRATAALERLCGCAQLAVVAGGGLLGAVRIAREGVARAVAR
jgi:hypothetical protein